MTKEQHTSIENNNRTILLEVALLDYCRFSNVSDADIALLYERVEQIKKDFENDKEYALDAMIQYDLENIKSKEDLKVRIKEKKAQIAGQILDYTGFSNTEKAFVFINTYLKSLGMKKDSVMLTNAMLSQKLNEHYDEKTTKADRLSNLLAGQTKQLKQNLAAHFEVYQKSKQKHDIVEQMRLDIEDHLSNVEQKTVFNFMVKAEDKAFRDLIRSDFNYHKKKDSLSDKDGVKTAFLKMYGYMMEAGMKVLNGEKSESAYSLFKGKLEAFFGFGYEDEMLKAFGASDLNECKKKFYEKSKSLYVKTVAALLSKKAEYDAEHKIFTTDMAEYIREKINISYIKGLQKGINQVSALGLVDEIGPNAKLSRGEEDALNKQLLGDLTDRQEVSVHHRVTIGSAKDIVQKLFGRVPYAQMRAIASDMVNTLGNVELVVGKAKHQSLEPKDKIVLSAEKSNIIFEARLSPLYMQQICKNGKIDEKLLTELKKYQNQTDISETLNFSESPYIAKERPKKINTLKQNLADKIRQYFKS
ncbi:MAG: hypothetical protein J5895_01980 [Alphaproteobacteria bacterium]|nr:hypothetical protein [Alphaproteobacteria bacterium]